MLSGNAELKRIKPDSLPTWGFNCLLRPGDKADLAMMSKSVMSLLASIVPVVPHRCEFVPITQPPSGNRIGTATWTNNAHLDQLAQSLVAVPLR